MHAIELIRLGFGLGFGLALSGFGLGLGLTMFWSHCQAAAHFVTYYLFTTDFLPPT